jgi:ketosteroid isomerase-like protein
MAVNRDVIGQVEAWDRSGRTVLDMDSSESPVHGQQEDTHERVDKIVLENGREIAGKYIAVFTLRDGKIVDWTDYEFERPAPRP